MPFLAVLRANAMLLAFSGALFAQNAKVQTPVTEAQRTFVGASTSYLSTANEQGTRVATSMAGASDGSSTLSDIKSPLSVARRVESVGYEDDYLKRIGGKVPTGFAAIGKNIDETHRLFQAAMSEYLEYWNDKNPAHIASGGRR